MKIRDFGKIRDGRHASLFILRNASGMTAAVTDFGASLVSLKVPDRDGKTRDVVLGHDNAAYYESGHGSLGATVGRFANRIGGARFTMNGRTYEPPKLVLFSGAVQSGCGGATSSSGPFYCSADRTVYIDLSFFMDMRRQIGADGDFAYAYVIAHEVGHHVQNLLGTLSQAHNQMARSSEAQSNQISVRLELQADFYAGIWGYYDNKMFGSLEEGDIQEALNAASKIGDDYLQKKARGYTVPESFNHGTSAQREKWLKKGLTTGNLSLGDTFSPNYRDL